MIKTEIRQAGHVFYIIDADYKSVDEDKYLGEDLQFHRFMGGKLGKWFSTKEEAQMLLDKYNMTKTEEEIKRLEERLEVIKHFQNNGKVEILNEITNKWVLSDNPLWWPSKQYRKAKEPKYRPLTYDEAKKLVGTKISHECQPSVDGSTLSKVTLETTKDGEVVMFYFDYRYYTNENVMNEQWVDENRNRLRVLVEE